MDQTSPEVSQELEVGSPFPSFTLIDQNGNPFSSDEFYDAPAVIYFYPKDDTPGCTTEACSFRDILEEMQTFDTKIVGISPDSPESHQKFIEKYQLNFPLLCDPEGSFAKTIGVWKEKTMYGKKYFGMERTTFVLDEEGKVCWKEQPVQVEGHVERVMEALSRFSEEH